MPILTNRRTLIGSMIALFASPAIVRASSIMPVKAFVVDQAGAYVMGNWIPFTVEGVDQFGNPMTETVMLPSAFDPYAMYQVIAAEVRLPVL